MYAQLEERIKRIEKALNLPAFKDHEWEEYRYGTGHYDRRWRCKWCGVEEAFKHRNCT